MQALRNTQKAAEQRQLQDDLAEERKRVRALRRQLEDAERRCNVLLCDLFESPRDFSLPALVWDLWPRVLDTLRPVELLALGLTCRDFRAKLGPLFAAKVRGELGRALHARCTSDGRINFTTELVAARLVHFSVELASQRRTTTRRTEHSRQFIAHDSLGGSRCFRCLAMGHISRDCVRPCKHCGMTGHTERDCRVK